MVTAVEAPLISTDPPYYDNVPYADLADFFYVWLRRSLAGVYPFLFDTLLTPKLPELVADSFRHGGRAEAERFFETGLGAAFASLRAAQHPDYPLTVYYAFKQTESDPDDGASNGIGGVAVIASTGWETMLQGLLGAGFAITGTWPMRSELGSRMRSQGSNALASSIVLVCRPRPTKAPAVNRREFTASLKHELPGAVRGLQAGNIAPVDLAQAAIGPGMAVFSRYCEVLDASGRPLTVRQALQLINQTLDEVLGEQEGEFDHDTRWAITWFEQRGFEDGPFGDAEQLSKARNVGVNGLVEAGIAQARGGRVRLMRRDELPVDWDPLTERRLTVWETTQHLIRALNTGGEQMAGVLLAKVVATRADLGEVARDLAYRLYLTCERKKWSQEGGAYNGLVVAWPSIQAHAAGVETRPQQATML